jgi:hypothetical protein
MYANAPVFALHKSPLTSLARTMKGWGDAHRKSDVTQFDDG